MPVKGSQMSVFHKCKGCGTMRWVKVHVGLARETTCNSCHTTYVVSTEDRISGYFKR